MVEGGVVEKGFSFAQSSVLQANLNASHVLQVAGTVGLS
jgi:hypothetical protein